MNREEFLGRAIEFHFDANKTPKRFSCVYLLMQGGNPIYAGQSCCLHNRIVGHKWDKVFDRILYVDVAPEHLDEQEKQLIEAFRPRLNRDLNPERDRNISEEFREHGTYQGWPMKPCAECKKPFDPSEVCDRCGRIMVRAQLKTCLKCHAKTCSSLARKSFDGASPLAAVTALAEAVE